MHRTPEPRSRAAVLVIVAFLAIAFRVIIHAHQGPAHAYDAGLWALGNILVFLASRSVIPLILAHVFFDFAVAGGLLDLEPALALVAAIGAAAAIYFARVNVANIPGRRITQLFPPAR